MRSLSRANAESVHCVTWNPEWSEFQGDPQAVMLVEMDNGVKVVYEGAKTNASQLNGGHQDYWRAECELATLSSAPLSCLLPWSQRIRKKLSKSSHSYKNT